MRKSTLFISAVLTTFVMAMLVGVVSAYQNMVKNQSVALQTELQPNAVANSEPTLTVAEVQPVNLTPEEATALASQVLGRDDLYSVEVVDLNGETVYLVTFSSGDLVYVSLDGQIRSIGKVAVETVIVSSGGGRGGGGNNRASSSSSSYEDHDDDDDHEEHDEHDDD